MKTPNSTGANRGNGGRKENLCSLCFLLFKSGRDGDADFVFLARDTALAATKSDEGWSPYIDNPDASGLFATKPELREYKAVYVLKDAEIGLFSDEVVVNCSP
jgi:hypothetical protein